MNTTPTLLTIDDASLLSIFLHLPLDNMNTLQHTCRHLHAFLHNPHNVIPLLKSPSHKHALTALFRFPRWSLNEKVLTATLAAPKPPILYVERFLVLMLGRREFAEAFWRMSTEMVRWYPDGSVGEKFKKRCPLWRHFSINRILGTAATGILAVLQRLVDEEGFPVDELFSELSTWAPLGVESREKDLLVGLAQSTWAQSKFSLRHILPRLVIYMSTPTTYNFVVWTYHNAPASEVEHFDQHTRQILNNPRTTFRTFLDLTGLCPHLVKADNSLKSFEFRHTRNAIYSSDRNALNPRLINAGVVPSHEDLAVEIPFTFALEPEFLIRWCLLVGKLIKRFSSDTSSAWHPRSAKTNDLMIDALFQAVIFDSHVAADCRKSVGVLLKYVSDKAGGIDWAPTGDTFVRLDRRASAMGHREADFDEIFRHMKGELALLWKMRVN